MRKVPFSTPNHGLCRCQLVGQSARNIGVQPDLPVLALQGLHGLRLGRAPHTRGLARPRSSPREGAGGIALGPSAGHNACRGCCPYSGWLSLLCLVLWQASPDGKRTSQAWSLSQPLQPRWSFQALQKARPPFSMLTVRLVSGFTWRGRLAGGGCSGSGTKDFLDGCFPDSGCQDAWSAGECHSKWHCWRASVRAEAPAYPRRIKPAILDLVSMSFRWYQISSFTQCRLAKG